MSDGTIATNGSGKDSQPQVENVIVVGSGPSGFTAGLYTARANLNPLLITGNDYGGQVTSPEVENPRLSGRIERPNWSEEVSRESSARIEFD